MLCRRVGSAFGFALFAIILYEFLTWYMVGVREQNVCKAIVQCGGTVTYKYIGPEWIPERWQSVAVLNRIQSIELHSKTVQQDVFKEWPTLGRLTAVDLSDGRIDANIATVLSQCVGTTSLILYDGLRLAMLVLRISSR
jgi:hypothetical protein